MKVLWGSACLSTKVILSLLDELVDWTKHYVKNLAVNTTVFNLKFLWRFSSNCGLYWADFWRAVSCYRRGSAGRPSSLFLMSLTLLSDLDDLPDRPCCLVRLTAGDSRLIPVDDVILCFDVIYDRRCILLWLWLFLGTSCVFLQLLPKRH